MTIKDAVDAVYYTKYLGFYCAHNQNKGTPEKPVRLPGNEALFIYNLVKWMIYDMSEHERAELLAELATLWVMWPL